MCFSNEKIKLFCLKFFVVALASHASCMQIGLLGYFYYGFQPGYMHTNMFKRLKKNS